MATDLDVLDTFEVQVQDRQRQVQVLLPGTLLMQKDAVQVPAADGLVVGVGLDNPHSPPPAGMDPVHCVGGVQELEDLRDLGALVHSHDGLCLPKTTVLFSIKKHKQR